MAPSAVSLPAASFYLICCLNMAARQLSLRLAAHLRTARIPQALPAALQLGAWFSTSAPPFQDAGQAAELAKQLRAQDFLAQLEPLAAQSSAVPHAQLVEFAEQQ